MCLARKAEPKFDASHSAIYGVRFRPPLRDALADIRWLRRSIPSASKRWNALRGGNPPFFSDPTLGGPFSDVVGDLLFAQSNNEATNKAGSNGSRSSTCSPTPT